jgi:hypothetical protein
MTCLGTMKFPFKKLNSMLCEQLGRVAKDTEVLSARRIGAKAGSFEHSPAAQPRGTLALGTEALTAVNAKWSR